MFPIEFLCLPMNGANIAGPVFLPNNTFVEQGCQFHYLSFEFAINCRCLSENSSFIVNFASCLFCSFSTAMKSQPIFHFLTKRLFSTDSHNTTKVIQKPVFSFEVVVFPIFTNFIFNVRHSLGSINFNSFEPLKGMVQDCFISFNSTSIITSTSEDKISK